MWMGAWILAATVVVFLTTILVQALGVRLREHHPETAASFELAEHEINPHDDEGDSRPTLRLLRFVLQRKYLHLDDPQAARLGGRLFVLLLLWPCLVAWLALLVPAPNLPAIPKKPAAAVVAPAQTSRATAFELHREHKWPQAIAAYDELVKREGEDAEILYWRGMAYWKSAQFDAAYRDFRRAIDLDPGNLEAYRNADRLLGRQKKWDEIITMWNWYISRQPPNAEAHFERSGAYFNKGDMASARVDATKACELGKVLGCRMVERLKGE